MFNIGYPQVGIITLIIWLIALVDILKSNFRGNNKIVWILVITFLPFLGSILYFIIGRKQKTIL